MPPPNRTASAEASSSCRFTQPLGTRSRIRLIISLCFAFSLCLHLAPGLISKNLLLVHASGSDSPPATSLWKIDFSTLPEDITQGLKDKGFQFEKEMAKPDRIKLSRSRDRLNITTSKPAFGLLVNKNLHVESVEWVEITWGVEHYPSQADWSNGKKQEAVMVYIFFGEPVRGDRFYLPDSPFFIGLFLGHNEAPLTPYTGKSYQKTGRYICLGNPEPGQPITSRYHIAAAYRDMFGTKDVPPVTGIAIEVDTGSLPGGTSSAAFIHTIGLQGATS